MSAADITLSVVSHRQNALVNQLLEDVERVCPERVALVVTENVPDETVLATSLPFEHIVNTTIKGFGANHNAAFARCRTPYFCVCNPDIRLRRDPFPTMVEALQSQSGVLVGPLVRNAAGTIEDSARRFPTAWTLLKKLFVDRRIPDYPTDRGPQAVDWVGGMFMLIRSDAYRSLGGFDEAYFLYYEDVDLCRRIRGTGREVIYDSRVEVVHDARRRSRRDLIHGWHHLASIARYLVQH